MIEDDRPFDPATLQTVFFPTNNMKSRNENWTTNHACWISEWFTEFLMPTFFQRVAQLVPTDEKMRSFHLSKLRLPKEPSFKLQSYEEHKAAQALHGFEHHSIHWFIVCRGPRRVKKVHILLLTVIPGPLVFWECLKVEWGFHRHLQIRSPVHQFFAGLKHTPFHTTALTPMATAEWHQHFCHQVVTASKNPSFERLNRFSQGLCRVCLWKLAWKTCYHAGRGLPSLKHRKRVKGQNVAPNASNLDLMSHLQDVVSSRFEGFVSEKMMNKRSQMNPICIQWSNRLPGGSPEPEEEPEVEWKGGSSWSSCCCLGGLQQVLQWKWVAWFSTSLGEWKQRLKALESVQN